MKMYRKDIDSNLFNVSIDGYDLIAEDFSPSESFNRRDTSRHNIIGGTQTVMRTTYIPRDISFVAHVLIDPLFPDVYDDILKVWMSKPVEVISKELGGKFKAECIVKKTHEKPNYLKLDIQLIEIPGKSLIPNDEFKVPSAKITVKSEKNDKNKNKNKDKDKNKGKNTRKTTNKGNNKNTKKGKGGKITTTKK